MNCFELAIYSIKINYYYIDGNIIIKDNDNSNFYSNCIQKFQKKLNFWMKKNPTNYAPMIYNFIFHLYINHYYSIKNKLQPIHDSSNKVYELISKNIYELLKYNIYNIFSIKYLSMNDNEKILYDCYITCEFKNEQFLNDLSLYRIYNFNLVKLARNYKSVRN